MNKVSMRLMGMLCLCLIGQYTYSQGCVAIRSGCAGTPGAGLILEKGQLQLSSNLRYFHSYKHFRGRHEESYRVKESSEVINDSYFADLIFSYGLSNRFAVNFVLPYVNHHRSSMYEHGGNPKADDPTTEADEYWAGDRHTTSTQGLGDIRLSFSYWVFDPAKSQKGNLSVGLGVKAPSGSYRAKDQFYNQGSEKNQTITSGVDQSIQPGDGGTGVTLDVLGFYTLKPGITVSANLYYLSNPREKYTLEARGSLRDYSVPDQYAARVGASFMAPIHGFSFYAGGRLEGVPSSDLFGKDDGFRRPGYVISLEPGVAYSRNRLSANVSVPVAVERNRTKSYTDKKNGSHGDAAFADYLINIGLTYRVGKKATAPIFNSTQSTPINLN